jgi:predicted lysophospholipase L1 biosynthesis ABC-type transport system permease subunit
MEHLKPILIEFIQTHPNLHPIYKEGTINLLEKLFEQGKREVEHLRAILIELIQTHPTLQLTNKEELISQVEKLFEQD